LRPGWIAALVAITALAPTGEAAAGGTSRLIQAAESAHATVLGVVQEPTRIDLHGYAAAFVIEQVLVGQEPESKRVRIAWEELAPGRPLRFSNGDRVLVALEPLPSGSLWRQRFPQGDALAVAARGEALLHDPSPGDIALLQVFLRFAPDQRDAPAGVWSLARLTAQAQPPLALAALDRLNGVPGLGQRLEPAAVAALDQALRNEAGRPLELRKRLVALAAERRLEGLRPSLEALAQPGSSLEPEAIEALAVLDGGLPEARVRQLLERPDGRLRALAVRRAGDLLDPAELAALLRSDPDAAVRAAAVGALVERAGTASLDDATPALFDADGRVRGEAARALGGLGEPAVPALRTLVLEHGAPEAAAPVAALGLAGTSGRAALVEIAETHSDRKVRAMARLALGRPLDPH
jgi:hypothetical protein